MTERATSHTLDGNAAAGLFTEIFGIDVSAVSVTCGECKGSAAFAEQSAFVAGPGTVLRCRGCDHVLARVVETPREVWLDVSGSASWRFPLPDSKAVDSQQPGQ
ncbi:MAG TPA: DUF6510 family protein [Nocardioides sp.]|uniref:DUF6510 family protein n=1 Tax=Nocardioides sp. TaxID=35761 RepID=UPI002D7FD7FB|nr:DUF6510 family protein [Nocardioides sp.]HET6653231.1 DUF6510 family protein [Nocardioides sp.]